MVGLHGAAARRRNIGCADVIRLRGIPTGLQGARLLFPVICPPVNLSPYPPKTEASWACPTGALVRA